MSTVREIEAAIAKLGGEEVKRLATWISKRMPPEPSSQRLQLLRKARGIWKNRNDLPNVQELRRDFDRL